MQPLHKNDYYDESQVRAMFPEIKIVLLHLACAAGYVRYLDIDNEWIYWKSDISAMWRQLRNEKNNPIRDRALELIKWEYKREKEKRDSNP